VVGIPGFRPMFKRSAQKKAGVSRRPSGSCNAIALTGCRHVRQARPAMVAGRRLRSRIPFDFEKSASYDAANHSAAAIVAVTRPTKRADVSAVRASRLPVLDPGGPGQDPSSVSEGSPSIGLPACHPPHIGMTTRDMDDQSV